MALLLDEYRITRDSMRYGFAVGKVRVLETRVLDHSANERLLDAPSYPEQKRLLSDSVYGRYLEGTETAEQVEAALDAALDDFYGFLEKAALPEAVVNFFRCRHDYGNLKGALKARLLGAPLAGLLVAHGTVSSGDFEGDLGELPKPLGELARELLSRTDLDAATVDREVDGAMFARLERLARQASSAYLVEIARLMIDLANVKSVVRARLNGLSEDAVEELLIAGGSVPVEKLSGLVGAEPAALQAALNRFAPLRGIDVAGLAAADTLDPATDAALLRMLATGRRSSAGPEPVISYVFAREAEVTMLRVLLLGRLAGIDTDTLRTRLRAGLR